MQLRSLCIHGHVVFSQTADTPESLVDPRSYSEVSDAAQPRLFTRSEQCLNCGILCFFIKNFFSSNRCMQLSSRPGACERIAFDRKATKSQGCATPMANPFANTDPYNLPAE